MENTVLVNISENPEYNPFGFWYMSEENATSVKYLAAHDNKRILRIYEIQDRFNVDMKAIYNKQGELLPPDRNATNKWVFRLIRLNITQSGDAQRQLAPVDLYGVQGVRYANLDI